MISAIVAAGVIFSILTYQYYMRNSSDIQHIAVEHIQSTTLVKVSDLAQILKNKLDLVTINLEMLSSSRDLIDQRLELGRILLNSTTSSHSLTWYRLIKVGSGL